MLAPQSHRIIHMIIHHRDHKCELHIHLHPCEFRKHKRGFTRGRMDVGMHIHMHMQKRNQGLFRKRM